MSRKKRNREERRAWLLSRLMVAATPDAMGPGFKPGPVKWVNTPHGEVPMITYEYKGWLERVKDKLTMVFS